MAAAPSGDPAKSQAFRQLPPTYVFQNGSLDLSADPGLSELHLDNFQFIARFPMNLERVSLRNGASFTYYEPVVVAGPVSVDGADLIAGVDGTRDGLTAASLLLDNGARWLVANHKSSGEAYPIRAASGSNKRDQRHHVWAGSAYDNRSHGGIGGLYSTSIPDRGVMDSYAWPDLYGGKDGGGLIQLQAGSMLLDGEIRANGGAYGSGGSILLRTGGLDGVCLIEARPGNSGARFSPNHNGGGRLAIYHGSDGTFLDTLRFDLSEDAKGGTYIGGAGTVFVKGTQ